MGTAEQDILVVGNYCHDQVARQSGETATVLGGSAAYIARVLAALGVPHRMVSKVGPDFAFHAEVPPGLISVQRPTTRFRLGYEAGERFETIEAVCEPIRSSDISGPAAIALACGVAFEIEPETLIRLRSCAELVFCDIQGLIRTMTASGRVQLRPFSETPFANGLHTIDYLKMSRVEAAQVNLAAVSQHTCVIVTEGPDGCMLLHKGRELFTPALPVSEVDATGAGDSFLAGLAAGLYRGLSLEKALRLGNACGALAVRQAGVPQLASADFETDEVRSFLGER